MLSRVAESVYWMARYVERAEHVARIVSVNEYLALDAAGTEHVAGQWKALLAINALAKPFEKKGVPPTRDNVLEFLVCDSENPSSLISCLRAARENARSIREIIPADAWIELNTAFHAVRECTGRQGTDVAEEFLSKVRASTHLFASLIANGMIHGEAFFFFELGRHIERADNTSRLIDVKYFILLPNVEDVGTAIDRAQWVAVLKSASAHQVYRNAGNKIEPAAVVAFLLTHPGFPRSVLWSLKQAHDYLEQLGRLGQVGGGFDATLAGMEQIASDLERRGAEEVIGGGLHEYIDGLQAKLSELHVRIQELFF